MFCFTFVDSVTKGFFFRFRYYIFLVQQQDVLSSPGQTFIYVYLCDLFMFK